MTAGPRSVVRAVDLVDEAAALVSNADGLVEAIEQGVERFAVAAHEHGKGVAAIGSGGGAFERRKRTEGDLTAVGVLPLSDDPLVDCNV